jgi:V8-like Glu-specific endopeptidase
VACPATANPSQADRSVLQTIDGELFKWHEYDLEGDTGQASVCIVLERPTLQELSAEDARQLLDASHAVDRNSTRGFTARAASTREAAQRSPATSDRSVERRGIDALAARNALSAGISAPVRQRLQRNRTSDVGAQGPAGKGAALRTDSRLVFGADNRTRVSDTSVFPWNTIVYVESEFPNGQVFGFSGVLIGSHSILTSALALYQDSKGGFAVDVLVVPGQSQERDGGSISEPFGSQFGEFLEVPQAWIDSEMATDIYGVVLLAEPFDGINSTMPLVFNALPAGQVNMAGYDQTAQGESNSFALWTRSGPLTDLDTVFFDHQMDDDAGAIGAPVWEFFGNNNTRRIFGLNCCINAGSTSNVGVRFTSDNRDLIEEWAAYQPDTGGGGGGTNPDPPSDAPILAIGGASGNRFEVTVGWQIPNGDSGSGQPIVLSDDSGTFWFFNDDNVEFLIKVLDGCAINNHYWVFSAGLTDVQVSVLVEDTVTGKQWRDFNPQGQGYVSRQDISALPVCP